LAFLLFDPSRERNSPGIVVRSEFTIADSNNETTEGHVMKQSRQLIRTLGTACAAFAFMGYATAQQPAQPAFVEISGAQCATPPILHCPDAECPRGHLINPGPVVELKSRRTYFLDYPCDLKKGEKVTFVLSLHGGGSYANWQRHYFPLMDHKDKYRLVIATPSSPCRIWEPADDEYLQNIVNHVVQQVGKENINAFWLAGHSQGGATSQRLLRSDFFIKRADGFLSLSGGRIGGNPGRADFGPIGGGRAITPCPNAMGQIPAARPAGGAGAAAAAPPPPAPFAGDFSHIYSTGRREMDEKGFPETSDWAKKYGCGPRSQPREVVDTRAGYVYDGTRINELRPPWGLMPAPGKAQIAVYPNCKDGRIVADIARLDKGHTEGYEPAITEEIIKMLVAAPGGKIQKGV
jgi:hypothetical protein